MDQPNTKKKELSGNYNKTAHDRSSRTWTDGFLIPNQALYQLSYTPIVAFMRIHTALLDSVIGRRIVMQNEKTNDTSNKAETAANLACCG